MDTPINRESVERLARDCHRLGGRADKNNLDGQYMRALWKAQDTLLALRAALDEAEAALDSAHAKVGSNIWRYWRDIAREQSAKRQEAEARADRAAQEARAVALQEAAAFLVGSTPADASEDSLIAFVLNDRAKAILALLDTRAAAEALERVRAEEREACAQVADQCQRENGPLSKKGFGNDYRFGLEAAGQAIAAAIRARGET